MKQMVLLGDTICLGYRDELRRWLADRAYVFGTPEPITHSADLLRNLGDWVLAGQPDLVHFNCGLNDLALPPGRSRPTIPLDRYRSNLEQIIHRIRGESGAQIVFATSTPIHEERYSAGANLEFERRNADVLEYNRVAGAVCQDLGVAVNDLYATLADADLDRLMAADGLHLNTAGYQLLAEQVATFLTPYCDR
ncbi:MAG: hypothetical protein GYB68_12670 [Chloroflexi bacterium]|nr:hypothetical protein [Chloroflexota bacterium]